MIVSDTSPNMFPSVKQVLLHIWTPYKNYVIERKKTPVVDR